MHILRCVTLYAWKVVQKFEALSSFTLKCQYLVAATTLLMGNNQEFKVQGTFLRDSVTGPPGALLFDVKPEIAQEKSL